MLITAIKAVLVVQGIFRLPGQWWWSGVGPGLRKGPTDGPRWRWELPGRSRSFPGSGCRWGPRWSGWCWPGPDRQPV